ncbi:MAG: Pyridoxine 5-phosphate synthase [Pseudomonadota bacterium]
MVTLSVNVNKIATLRNSRGGHQPSVLEALEVILAAGAKGVTIHPRADERHITRADVEALSAALSERRDTVEFNIEGDPRPELMDAVCRVRPHQCTLVPVRPGEVTSEAGWDPSAPVDELAAVIQRLQKAGVRVSVFVDPEPGPVRWAKAAGADRVELYTEPFAREFEKGPDHARASFARYSVASTLAHELGMGVNAGHDLDLENLPMFRALPYLAEVSIGHALISRALFVGLDRVVREYLATLAAS